MNFTSRPSGSSPEARKVGATESVSLVPGAVRVTQCRTLSTVTVPGLGLYCGNTRYSILDSLPMDKQRFLNLCARNASQASEWVLHAWFDTVAARYLEAHRRYHTPQHVQHCLEQLDLVHSMLKEPDAVELALWYHDAVYDGQSTENEVRSAALFRAEAGCAMDEGLVDTVHELIMVTVHSRIAPRTSDQRFMVDIDLSSFGLPWPRFLADSIAVRDEFPQLSDDEFFPSQEQFLRGLLARQGFYLTEFFRARNGQQARENILRYLRRIEEGRCA